MKFDLSRLLEISARTAGAITVACAFLLFFPAIWLPFDIAEFRSNYGTLVFVVWVISIAIWTSYFIKWISNIIKEKIKLHKTWETYKYILKNLSNSEKSFLKDYYDKRETTIFIDLSDPVHKKLQTFQVISATAGTSLGSLFGVPGFIQPWVFELIDKKPSYLKIKQGDKSNG